MNMRLASLIDRHVTGNYGEDAYFTPPRVTCIECGAELDDMVYSFDGDEPLCGECACSMYLREYGTSIETWLRERDMR